MKLLIQIKMNLIILIIKVVQIYKIKLTFKKKKTIKMIQFQKLKILLIKIKNQKTIQRIINLQFIILMELKKMELKYIMNIKLPKIQITQKYLLFQQSYLDFYLYLLRHVIYVKNILNKRKNINTIQHQKLLQINLLIKVCLLLNVPKIKMRNYNLKKMRMNMLQILIMKIKRKKDQKLKKVWNMMENNRKMKMNKKKS